MIRKVYARDLKANERVHTVFKVTKKARTTARSGKSFLTLTLSDKTGEVDARVFDQADAIEPTFQAEDYVLVKGQVITFHGRLQVVLESLDRLDPEPIDPAEFAYQPRPAAPAADGGAVADEGSSEGDRAVGQIREHMERVQDPNVRALLLAVLDDPQVGAHLPTVPAAKGVHHAYKGGLAEHLLSVIRLAHRVADHYPMADRDLLVAGALLHDVYKVREMSFEKGNVEYTDEGRLVGHLVMTAQAIREKAARIPGFPPLLEHHLTHIVLAHHGQVEYGSPKVPMTLEALLVHLIDLMDSRVASWLEIMSRDSGEKWTDISRLYERHLWKGAIPTVRARGPVDGRKPRGPKPQRGVKEQRGPKEARKQEARDRDREARRSRPAAPREETPARAREKERADEKPAPKERDPGLPKDLTFKPFNLLAGQEGGSGEAPPEGGAS